MTVLSFAGAIGYPRAGSASVLEQMKMLVFLWDGDAAIISGWMQCISLTFVQQNGFVSVLMGTNELRVISFSVDFCCLFYTFCCFHAEVFASPLHTLACVYFILRVSQSSDCKGQKHFFFFLNLIRFLCGCLSSIFQIMKEFTKPVYELPNL